MEKILGHIVGILQNHETAFVEVVKRFARQKRYNNLIMLDIALLTAAYYVQSRQMGALRAEVKKLKAQEGE